MGKPKSKAKGKQHRPAKKSKTPIVVEDHGNGFMVLGTNDIAKAINVLAEYADDVAPYRFNMPVFYGGGSAVWLATGPGEFWEGAQHPWSAEPLPR